MRLIKLMVFSIVLLANSCNTTKEAKAETDIPNETKLAMEINSLTYTTFTRGFKDEFIVTENAATYQVVEGNEKGGQSVKKISSEEWNEVIAMTQAIDVQNLSSYKAPSTDSYSDKGLAAVLKIEQGDTVFTSVQFDHANPPKEFKSLIKKISDLTGKKE